MGCHTLDSTSPQESFPSFGGPEQLFEESEEQAERYRDQRPSVVSFVLQMRASQNRLQVLDWSRGRGPCAFWWMVAEEEVEWMKQLRKLQQKQQEILKSWLLAWLPLL